MKLIIGSISLIDIEILIRGDYMKRICSFILVLLLTLSLLGCNSNNIRDDEKKAPSVDPGIIGYVMQKDNKRILVISQRAQDFSSTGGVNEYYDAIWFSNAPNAVEVGDKVKVWYDIVAESYPGQSEAKHIEVISSQKPNGANLTESEALKKALASEKIKAKDLTVLKSIVYDKQADRWNVELKEIWSDKIDIIQIEDK